MSASDLWDEIDQYLSTAILAEMGAGSAYPDLAIQQAIITPTWEPQLWTLPAVAINGSEVTMEGGPHAGGEIMLEPTYQYVLAAVVNVAAYATARTQAKELARRLREVMRDATHYTLGGLSVGGETVIYTQIPRSQIFAFNADGSVHAFYGVGRLELNVYTEIGGN